VLLTTQQDASSSRPLKYVLGLGDGVPSSPGAQSLLDNPQYLECYVPEKSQVVWQVPRPATRPVLIHQGVFDIVVLRFNSPMAPADFHHLFRAHQDPTLA
jgi:hypothetical protein